MTTKRETGKITEITDAHRAMFARKVQEWTAVGFSCEPADWDTGIEGIRALYSVANVPFPEGRVVRVISPRVGARAASLAQAVKKATPKDAPPASDEVFKTVYTAASAACGFEVNKDTPIGERTWHQWLGSSFWPGYAAWYDAVLDMTEMARCDAGDAYVKVARSVCYWWANTAFVIVCDRPAHIHLDDQGRLHHESAKAIEWRDGWGCYSWHGVRLPQEYEHAIHTPSAITVQQVRKCENMEVRRVLMERYGIGRYLADIKAEIVDMDSVPVDALAPKDTHIVRGLLRDDRGQLWMVANDGSTPRVYHWTVPEGTKTCREGYISLLPPGCPPDAIMEC